MGADDHVRGESETLIVYADLGCPHCAAAWQGISSGRRVAFRHFPWPASAHVRRPARGRRGRGGQDRFFELVDSLYADQATRRPTSLEAGRMG